MTFSSIPIIWHSPEESERAVACSLLPSLKKALRLRSVLKRDRYIGESDRKFNNYHIASSKRSPLVASFIIAVSEYARTIDGK